MKDFSGNASCHPPEAKTWASRPQVPEPRPQAPDLYDDDLEFRPPSWPQSSDNQQYFCAPAPLSPSARPRSPWGKLDPYDSSEVEPPALHLPFSGLLQEDRGQGAECVCVCVCVFVCVCVSGTSFSPVSALAPRYLPPRALEICSFSKGRRPSWWPQMGTHRSLALLF